MLDLETSARRLAACVVESGCEGEAAASSARRMGAAGAILDAQFADVDRGLSDDETLALVPLLMRYRRAAQEGAPDYNLSLLAQAIANIARDSMTSTEEFLPLADILAIISPREMDVVQSLHQYVNDCGMLLRDKTKRSASAERRAIEALVPSVFKSEDEFRSVAAGLLRTGLIEPMIIHGGIMYAPSALVDRLDRIIPLGDCPNSRRAV